MFDTNSEPLPDSLMSSAGNWSNDVPLRDTYDPWPKYEPPSDDSIGEARKPESREGGRDRESYLVRWRSPIPIGTSRVWRPKSPILLSPKSVSFKCPCWSMSKLSGFRSLVWQCSVKLAVCLCTTSSDLPMNNAPVVEVLETQHHFRNVLTCPFFW
jgi:hypothetical protein